uniref:Uncharacterized protein n=1 Tax=Candidatus Kentrum sp. LFY TaxID=2126342 RepID=A0A450V7U6_9GAMM|nr:MAG: hypothetical protein BECKLFY1418B_GA0070995_12142 [Candidatus Kentron sp. LFY]
MLSGWYRNHNQPSSHRFHGPVQRAVIELDLLHKSLETTIEEGLAQTSDYLGRVGTEERHLIIFDCRPDIPWEKKVFTRKERQGEFRIGVWGM